MSMLSRVRRTIRDHGLAGGDTRVVAAVSGGPDSVALAHLLAELADAGELVLSGLAHFNHELRSTALRDEQFCRDLAASLGRPIEVGRADVATLARQQRRSVEAAAHAARLAFFDGARQALEADVVAVGHTRDDQAETFLLRLLRGAGARGLAAMHPRSERVVRPLLDCRRADLLEWLQARGLRFVLDETNADLTIPRNRIRAELLPLLASGYNPAIVDVLADAAELARGEWLWLEAAADRALADSAVLTDDRIEIDVARLAELPLALRRAVLWRAMTRLGSRAVGFEHVSAVAALLESTEAGQADIPGETVERVGARLVLKKGGGERSAAAANLFAYSLSIPGEVVVPEAGGVLSVEEPRPDVVAALNGRNRPRSRAARPWLGDEAVVRRDLCGGRLLVRSRRPGDRFKGAGRRGARKLQDVFVDAKIGRALRDRIPIVAAENGRIVWVAGFGIAEEVRVTDPAQPMLILRFKGLGGSA